MSFNKIFKKKIPIPSANLPLTLISVTNWTLVKIKGPDTIQYLHNQLTCDIKNLNQNQYRFAAHCNNTGKMISNMYIFHYTNQEIAFIEPSNIYKKQISIMKKYAIFSNITINSDNNTTLIGIAGLNARQYLNTFFNLLPNKNHTLIRYPNIILLYFHLPTERFLLIIDDQSFLTDFLNKSQNLSIQYNDYNQWIALDIEAGYPCIADKTSEIFFPQSANLDTLQGISFNKGCYLGQEMIAKIQYRKLIKQTLYKLSGHLHDQQTNLLPTTGDNIELKITEQNWKHIGTILQSCQIKNHNILIQAILNNTINTHNTLHIRISNIHRKVNLYMTTNIIN